MESQELVRWMRQEHRKVEDIARELRERVAGVPRTGLDGWIGGLRQQFEHIRAHLHKHVALEEHDGYMAEVLVRRPMLSNEIDRLQHEHTEFARLMDGIRQAIENLTPADRLLIRDCCQRINDFLSYIEHHEAHENLIAVAVFTHDIGTED